MTIDQSNTLATSLCSLGVKVRQLKSSNDESEKEQLASDINNRLAAAVLALQLHASTTHFNESSLATQNPTHATKRDGETL